MAHVYARIAVVLVAAHRDHVSLSVPFPWALRIVVTSPITRLCLVCLTCESHPFRTQQQYATSLQSPVQV
jgi:hypothetical protein